MRLAAILLCLSAFTGSFSQAQDFQISGLGLRDSFTGDAIALRCLPKLSPEAADCSRMQFFEFAASTPNSGIAIGPIFQNKEASSLPKLVQDFENDQIREERELKGDHRTGNFIMTAGIVVGSIVAVVAHSFTGGAAVVVFWQLYKNRSELFQPTGISKAFTGSVQTVSDSTWIAQAKAIKHEKYAAFRGVLPVRDPSLPEWIIEL